MSKPEKNPGIILLGLGPGDPGQITRQAWQILEDHTEVWLRTRQHPAVADLPVSLDVHSFDDIYENGDDFAQVYAVIVARVLELGRRPQGVVYAVPGHPFVAEATSPEIYRQARAQGLAVQVVEGLSFLEPTLTALGLDPFPQLALVDALEMAATHVPQFSPASPVLICQIHSRAVASEVKLSLNALYPDEFRVTLVHAAGTPMQVVEPLPLYQIDRSRKIGLLTTLFVPALGPAASFESLQEVIARLRAPDGCPWDREQTHLSLRRYLLEETYEVLAALDAEDNHAMREEFGDLLLQIVLHAQIASEEGNFSMADILNGINHKMVRRHPHVFGDIDLESSQAVLQNWEKLKSQERAEKGNQAASLLDGVALTLPALVQTEQYLLRASRVGFDWPEINFVYDKINEELREVVQAGEDRRSDEIGDLLFAVANLARWFHIDPEAALRQTNGRFRQRFGHIEAVARSQNHLVSELSLAEMESLWNQAKNL